MTLRTLFRKWTLTSAVLIGAVLLSPFLLSDTMAYLGALAVSLLMTVPIDYSGQAEAVQ